MSIKFLIRSHNQLEGTVQLLEGAHRLLPFYLLFNFKQKRYYMYISKLIIVLDHFFNANLILILLNITINLW
jgi:hypothetical protein